MSLPRPALSTEVEAAWRFLKLNWLVCAAITAVLAFSLLVTDFSLTLPGVAVAIGYVGVYGGFAHANAASPKRRDPQVMFVLGALAQTALIAAVMTPLTYVAAAPNLPLQDANLLAIDRALGLDWAAYVRYVNAHPVLAAWLGYGYSMIRWQVFAVPVVLAAKGLYQRIAEFIFAFALALIATTIISALVPAIGVYQQIGLDPASLAEYRSRRLSRAAARPAADARRHAAASRSVGTLRHRHLSELSRGFGRALFLGAVGRALDQADRGGGERRAAVSHADRRRSLFHRHFRRRRHRGRGDRGVAPGRTDGGAPASRLRRGADPHRRAG
ncbi:MAG: phosphatase PAP2 family protein [Xanthobacteraceae bacterium]|jgi:hypothetical protein